ncbi:hypothetical protein PFLUV_G00142210 [Perca fluviatilis]|uniref:Uncharacterized protein n=1 Tax=Perca fluviatilis TaxID=8168 RepID=A0A6A5EMV0_PERFL|nr:hypothetical protein PFLUV_G00142210 [Perca fluviatilis]
MLNWCVCCLCMPYPQLAIYSHFLPAGFVELYLHPDKPLPTKIMDLGQKQTAAAEKLMALISGSRTRPVADSNSVVTDRTITNVKGNNFNMAVNTVSYPGSGPSGKAGGEDTQADCSARGGSVICTDHISDVDVKGDIDFSVTVKPANAQ